MRLQIRADRRVGLLLGGVVLLSFIAIGTTIALPASDPALRTARSGLSARETHGMEVFKAEGCWFCHTGYVRETSVDAPFGKSLAAKAYTGRSPSMLGTERIGPDLTSVSTRYPDAASLVAYLADPSTGAGVSPATRPRRSAMPSYHYLSDNDLEALAAYLLSRK